MQSRSRSHIQVLVESGFGCKAGSVCKASLFPVCQWFSVWSPDLWQLGHNLGQMIRLPLDLLKERF